MSKNLFKKISLTILLLTIYRLGSMVIVPGLDSEVLYPFFIQSNFNPSGIISHFTLFGNGINQYIMATALLLVISIFSKKLRGLFLGSDVELIRFEKIVLILTVIFLAISVTGSNYYLKSLRHVFDNSWNYGSSFQQFQYISFKIIGGIVVVFIAKLITKAGIINGVLAIFLLNYFISLKSNILSYIAKQFNEPVNGFDFLIAVLLIFILVSLCFFFVKGKRIIKINEPYPGSSKTDISININTVGLLPIIISGAILAIFLDGILPFLEVTPAISDLQYYSIFITLTTLLIILAAYMNFDSKNIYSTLAKFNYLIDKNEKRNMGKIYKLLVFNSIFFLILISLFPLLISLILKINYHPVIEFSDPLTLIFIYVLINLLSRFNLLKSLDESYIKISDFNTQLEAELFQSRLRHRKINPIINNTRVLSITGTESYWDLCVPRIPFFIPHRNMGGGSVSLYVKKEQFSESVKILNETVNTFPDAEKK